VRKVVGKSIITTIHFYCSYFQGHVFIKYCGELRYFIGVTQSELVTQK